MKELKKIAIGLIPARMESSRLPNKALLDIRGMPMVIHVALRAKLAKKIQEIYVCTDSEKIAHKCIKYNIKVILTKSSHINGTERIAEAVILLKLKATDIVVDIQGDEPLLIPEMVDNMVSFIEKSNYRIAVPYIKIDEKFTPNMVKIVESNGNILYLSRANAPYQFMKSAELKKHLSIVGFRVDALKKFAKLKPGILETVEGVELLRALENNIKIGTYEEIGETQAVDTIEDYHKSILLMNRDKHYSNYFYEL